MKEIIVAGILFVISVFAFVFVLNGFEVVLQVGWLSYIAITVIIITFIYAIVSSVVIEKKKKYQK